MTVPFYLAAGARDQRGRRARSAACRWHRSSSAARSIRSSPRRPSCCIERRRWRMWYVSGSEWRQTESGPRHYYHIRYAESRRRRRTGVATAASASTTRRRTNTPSPVRASCATRDGYRMWYAVRGDRYRIGYAESADGLTWTRRDDDRRPRPEPATDGNRRWSSTPGCSTPTGADSCSTTATTTAGPAWDWPCGTS